MLGAIKKSIWPKDLWLAWCDILAIQLIFDYLNKQNHMRSPVEMELNVFRWESSRTYQTFFIYRKGSQVFWIFYTDWSGKVLMLVGYMWNVAVSNRAINEHHHITN